MASTLDTAKLAKVRALMDRGATEGERAAARRKAESIAKVAGLTLDAALSKLDDRPEAKPRSFFDGFDDWMEAKEPGYKARAARERAERLAKRNAQKASALRRFGSEAAIIAETPQEALLSAAVAPLKVWKDYEWEGRTLRYVTSLDGWGESSLLRELPISVRSAVENAYAMPATLAGALGEWKQWDDLNGLRQLFTEDEYHTPLWIRARMDILEEMLTHASDPTPKGVEARIKWLHYWAAERQTSRGDEAETLTALRADIGLIKMDASPGQPASPWRSADKRAAVLSMLADHPGLSDREIARRLSVSPQTVNTWRKKRAKEAS